MVRGVDGDESGCVEEHVPAHDVISSAAFPHHLLRRKRGRERDDGRLQVSEDSHDGARLCPEESPCDH